MTARTTMKKGSAPKRRGPLVSRDKRTVYVDDPEYYGYEYDGRGDYVQYDEDDEGREYPRLWSYGDEFDDEMSFVEEYMRKHDGPYIMYGTVGLWDGGRVGGRIVRDFDDFGDAISPNYAHELEIYDEDGDLHIVISHHDGRHHMVMRELTAKGRAWYDKHATYSGYLDADEISHLATTRGYTKRMNFADEMYGKIPKTKKKAASKNAAKKTSPAKKKASAKKAPAKRKTGARR